MSALKKLVSDTAWYGLSSILGRFINYLLVPIYVRTLSQVENGILTDFYAYVTFLIIVFTYGMETAFFRFSNKEEYQSEEVYTTTLYSILSSSVLFTGLLILFAPSIAQWLKYPDHPEYVIYFALILGLDAVSTIPFNKLRQQGRPVKFVTGRLFNIGVNVALNLFFLVLCPWLLKNQPDSVLLKIYNPFIGVGYVFIANLIASIFTLLFLSKDLLSITGNLNKALWKKMFVYAYPLMFAGLAGMTNESFSRVILKYILPYSSTENLRQLGIFGQCYKLSIFMALAIQTFRMASEPFFFSLSKQADARQVYASVMNYFVLICCIIFIGVMAYIDIIKYFLTPAYFEGLIIVPVLLIAYIFLGIYQNLSIWFKLADKSKYAIYFTLIGAVLTIAANFFLVPGWGYFGSAVATLICYFTMALLCYRIGQKYYQVPYNIGKITVYLITSIAIYLLSEMIRHFILDPGTWIFYMVQTILLMSFVLVAGWIEWRSWKKLRKLT